MLENDTCTTDSIGRLTVSALFLAFDDKNAFFTSDDQKRFKLWSECILYF